MAMKAMSETALPKGQGGGKGAKIASPAHTSVTGGAKNAGSKMSVKDMRSAGSKR